MDMPNASATLSSNGCASGADPSLPIKEENSEISSNNAHPFLVRSDKLNEEGTSIASKDKMQDGNVLVNTEDRTKYGHKRKFSEDEKPMPKERLDWLVFEFNDFMNRAPAKGRFLFALAIIVVSILAPLLILKLPPFTRLTFHDRIRALRKLETRPAGKVLIPLRAILCLIYYEHPEAAADLQLHHKPAKLVQVAKK